jgi:O-antigen ligase
MPPLKGLLFLGLFLFVALSALFAPYLGVYGYIADYCLGASNQWWGKAIAHLGVRFSFTLALATALGMLLNWGKLSFGDQLLTRQEKLLLLFLFIVWFSSLINPETRGRYSTVDHPTMKFSKVVFFCFLMTHIITDIKKLSGLFWVLVTISLLLGIQAWSAQEGAFRTGRLEGIGGADFFDANYFAAFMAAILPIIGIQFLRAKWYGKIFCFFSAAFATNAVILCRSRGAFLGILVGIFASFIWVPTTHRKKLVICVILGALGGLYLSDEAFIERIGTIDIRKENLDESAFSRIRLWTAGLKMVIDHPLGVGAGNWYQNIERYIPEYVGKDSHSGYVKCIAELGLHGVVVFFALLIVILKSLLVFRNLPGNSYHKKEDIELISFSLLVSISILLTCCVTMSLIYAEFLWIMLSLVVCLKRSVDNLNVDSFASQEA